MWHCINCAGEVTGVYSRLILVLPMPPHDQKNVTQVPLPIYVSMRAERYTCHYAISPTQK